MNATGGLVIVSIFAGAILGYWIRGGVDKISVRDLF